MMRERYQCPKHSERQALTVCDICDLVPLLEAGEHAHDPEILDRYRELVVAYAYSLIPELKCQGKCGGELCLEPAPVAGHELHTVRKASGGAIPDSDPQGICPMLHFGAECSIHADRPAICRMYGSQPAVPGEEQPWRCPHGCEPERIMTEPEAMRVMSILGMPHLPLRSTSETVNRFLDAEGADAWYWLNVDKDGNRTPLRALQTIHNPRRT